MATSRDRLDGPTGILVVDKPAGWTSHDVVGRVRRIAGTPQVGHAGTLDPMATGVLVLGLGRATRLLGFIGGADKDYDATIRLGVATSTDDAEGEVIRRADASGVDEAGVARAVAGLTGDILQVPSSVSAIKVDGRRAYDRVRAGESVSLAARPVTVRRFDVHTVRRGADDSVAWIDLAVSVTVSSGTYVRALARDLGAALGIGGHLTTLRRTRIGRLSLADATRLDDLVAAVEGDRPLPIVALADAARAVLAHRDVSAEDFADLAHGRRVAKARSDGEPTTAHPIALIGPGGDLAALAVADDSGQLRPIAVFAAAEATS